MPGQKSDLHVNTREFAELIGMKESELIHLYQTTTSYQGLCLPGMFNATRKRTFRFSEVMSFAQQLKSRQVSAK